MSEYNKRPAGFVTCEAGEGECPLREHCLRSKAHQELMRDGSNDCCITVVNRHNPSIGACSEQCKMYLDDTPVRLARGMTHLFDHVPVGILREVQAEVQQCFSCRRYYYYCRKGERLIMPVEQQAIAAVLKSHGVMQAPQFDCYEEGYAWR